MTIYLLHFEGEIQDYAGAEDRLKTYTSLKDAQRAFKEAQEEYCAARQGRYSAHSVCLVKATLKKLSPKRMICLALEAPDNRSLFETWDTIYEHESRDFCNMCEYCLEGLTIDDLPI